MGCEEKQSQMGVLPGKLLLQSSVGSSPVRVEELVLFLILWKLILILQVSGDIYDQYQRGPACRQEKKGDNQVYWTMWIPVAWYIRPTGL